VRPRRWQSVESLGWATYAEALLELVIVSLDCLSRFRVDGGALVGCPWWPPKRVLPPSTCWLRGLCYTNLEISSETRATDREEPLFLVTDT